MKLSDQATGLAAGIGAFSIWGLSPIYWKMLRTVPALEIISHRIIWSFLFLVSIILLRRRGRELMRTFHDPRTLAIFLLTALLVAGNWLLYVWSVNNGHVLEASLGYYINPLVNVLLGTIFLKERFHALQIVAVLMAGSGVLYLTLAYGDFPWIALTLAFSFGSYGLIRKVTAVGALIGLAIETLMLAVPAVGYVVWLKFQHTGMFLANGPSMDFLLLGGGLVTAMPLLLFTTSARLIRLSTLGFLQYIAPTGMFLLGVLVYGEPFQKQQGVTFALIWAALALYTLESLRHQRHHAQSKFKFRSS